MEKVPTSRIHSVLWLGIFVLQNFHRYFCKKCLCVLVRAVSDTLQVKTFG